MLIKEAECHKTDFSSHHVLYKFKKLLSGPRNAPASLQRAIDIILSSVRLKCVMVYLHEIIVFLRNFDELLDNIETVLQLLQNAGMKSKLNKCIVMHESIEYLDHIVKRQEVLFAHKTIEAVQKIRRWSHRKKDAIKIHFRTLKRVWEVSQGFCMHCSSTQQTTEEILERRINYYQTAGAELHRT